ESSILWAVVNTRELLSRPKLAPSCRFSFGIDKYPVGASFLDEFSLLPTVPHRPLSPSPRLPELGRESRSLMVHAPTPPPTYYHSLFQEAPFNIRPSPLRQFLC